MRAGVNLFDVSPYYGRGRAERVLGAALRDVPRDQFVLSTKVGRYEVSSFDFSAERVSRSIDESLERLGVDRVDMALCHDVEFGDLDVVATETLPALARLRDSGKLRAVGLSAYPLEALAYVAAAAPPGCIDVVLSYCNYSLQNDRLSKLLPYFARENISVINASPLSMGLLTNSGPPAWHPAPTAVRESAKAAAQVCQQAGTDIARVALQYAFAAPHPVASTLVGIGDVGILEKNVEAANAGAAPAQLLRQVQEALGESRNVRWDSGNFLA